MRKPSRPTIDTKPNDPRHWQRNERIIFAGSHNNQAGALISLRETETGLVIEIYRADPQVRVVAPAANLVPEPA